MQIWLDRDGENYKAAFARDRQDQAGSEVVSTWEIGRTENEALGKLFRHHGYSSLEDKVDYTRTFQAACTWTDESDEAMGRYFRDKAFGLRVKIIPLY
jgi:hypothetical protein